MRIKKNVINLYDYLLHKIYLRTEINKFEDARRISIYSRINLSSEQENEISKLYINHYGKNIPLIWHKYYTAFTGKFDKNYFPELLYIPEFEKYMNYYSSYAEVIEDKNMLYVLAQSAGVKMPQKIISCQSGLYKDRNENVITISDIIKKYKNIGLCFIKPSVDSCSGNGCRVLNIEKGIDTISGEEFEKILNSIGNDFVLQEKLICHKTISNIYDKSVNTFRIITYRWKNELLALPVIMRIGQKDSYLDNAHAGGMFIAVENDGTFHKTAFTEFNNQFNKHPDSDLIFNGYKIDLLPNVIEKAKKLHLLVPNIGIINWDMTIDSNGNPVLIEANVNGGSIWLPQIAHGCGAFGDKTVEILEWIRLMNSIKQSDRKNYLFGKMK